MPPAPAVRPAPFPSAEAAWFCTARALEAGRTGSDLPVERVVRCLDRLYRNRRIELLHARILRIWGRRGIAPNPARPRERSDWRIWREAIERLDGPLRAQGVVAGLPAPASEPVAWDATARRSACRRCNGWAAPSLRRG